MEKEFDLTQLAQYDGQDGRPAYVAIDGVVYDVTAVPALPAWKGGKHHGNTAGNDLSAAIAHAPHEKAVLTKLPKVGTLK